MTEDEVKEMATWFYDRFPGVGAATLRALKRELMDHDVADAKQAATEFLATGERFLEVSRVVAITYRIRKQRHEREALKQREHFKQMEQGRESRLASLWAEVEAWVADVSDEDLAPLKADVLAAHDSGFRRVLEKRDPRTSRTLKALIFERVHGRRVAV